MNLILVHILVLALAFIAIYKGLTTMIKYIKTIHKYKGQGGKYTIRVGMILLSIAVMSCGIFLLYTEIESFVAANS